MSTCHEQSQLKGEVTRAATGKATRVMLPKAPVADATKPWTLDARHEATGPNFCFTEFQSLFGWLSTHLLLFVGMRKISW